MSRNSLATILVLFLAIPASAQDTPLSDVLIPGEGWRLLTEKFRAPSTLACDAEGRVLIFSGKQGRIVRLEEGGKLVDVPGKTKWIGLAPGLDGAVLGVVASKRGKPGEEESDLVRLSGKAKGLVGPILGPFRDILVGPGGSLLYTTPGAQHVTCGGKEGVCYIVHLKEPSALTVTPDGGTLYVGDRVGPFLLAFRIDRQGKLSAGERYATVRTRPGQPSGTRALAIDRLGRIYAATAEGVQVFDRTGRMSGVLTSPEHAPVTALTLAGPRRNQLVIICGGKVHGRTVQVEPRKKGKKGKK